MNLEGLDLTEKRALLKAARMVVRRHRSILKKLDRQPEVFVVGKGREIIRAALTEACVKVREIEVAMGLDTVAAGQVARWRR